eukprot:g10945.t2
MGMARNNRTRLFESIRSNREKIGRAMDRLRDAMRSGDDELAERLKAFIMHLRKKDPQYATQDAMDDALEQGLFSTAAKSWDHAPARKRKRTPTQTPDS